MILNILSTFRGSPDRAVGDPRIVDGSAVVEGESRPRRGGARGHSEGIGRRFGDLPTERSVTRGAPRGYSEGRVAAPAAGCHVDIPRESGDVSGISGIVDGDARASSTETLAVPSSRAGRGPAAGWHVDIPRESGPLCREETTGRRRLRDPISRVVSLERTPERLAAFRARWAGAWPAAETAVHAKGVDGADAAALRAATGGRAPERLPGYGLRNQSRAGPGALACTLSHLSALADALREADRTGARAIAMFEDDAAPLCWLRRPPVSSK